MDIEIVFGLMLALATAALIPSHSAHAEEDYLRPKHGEATEHRASKECLEGHCLETLDRDAGVAHCSGASSQPGTGVDRNLLGIRTQGYWQGCWWSDAPPPTSCFGVPAFRYSQLALSSSYCSNKIGNNAITDSIMKCRRESGFTGVDVFLALDKDFVPHLDTFADMHPWRTMKNSLAKDNVLTMEAHSLAELQQKMFKLLSECKVINYILVDTHGSPGYITFDGANPLITTRLISEGLACALTPGSRVQFTSCNQACGKAAQRIKEGLTKIANYPSLAPADGKSRPFEGTKFLFNSDLGLVSPGNYVKSVNDIGVEYSIRGESVAMDEPSPRACAPKETVKFDNWPFSTEKSYDIDLRYEDSPLISNPF